MLFFFCVSKAIQLAGLIFSGLMSSSAIWLWVLKQMTSTYKKKKRLFRRWNKKVFQYINDKLFVHLDFKHGCYMPPQIFASQWRCHENTHSHGHCWLVSTKLYWNGLGGRETRHNNQISDIFQGIQCQSGSELIIRKTPFKILFWNVI